MTHPSAKVTPNRPAADDRTSAEAPRRLPPSRYLVFALVACAGCGLDLATKEWAFQSLGMPPQNRSYWLWEGVFGFTTSLNEGALFGMGQGQGTLFVALSFVALAAVLVWLFYYQAARDWVVTLSLGLVTAGILGNLYDRMGLPGLMWLTDGAYHEEGELVYAVRDWLDFRLINWPIFNLADSMLVCGTLVLLWYSYKHPEETAAKAEADNAEGSQPTA